MPKKKFYELREITFFPLQRSAVSWCWKKSCRYELYYIKLIIMLSG